MTALLAIIRSTDTISKRALFDAQKSAAVAQLARRVSAQRAALVEATGALGVVAEAIELGLTDEAALRAHLSAEVAALGGLISEARAGNVSLDAFCKAAQQQFDGHIGRAMHVELNGVCVEIPRLEGLIRGFERARADHREHLHGASLTDAQINGADLLRPNYDDLDEWVLALEAKREQVARAKAFLASGPLFDLTILGEDAH